MFYFDWERRLDIEEGKGWTIADAQAKRQGTNLRVVWLAQVLESQDNAQNAWNWKDSKHVIIVQVGQTYWEEKIVEKTFEKK